MTERRRYRRYRTNVEVEYDVDNTVEIKSRTRTQNISEGGVCMPMNKAVKLGKKVLMKIRLPASRQEVTALGKVVWKRPVNPNLADEEDAGIKFLGMYDDGKSVLTGYLNSISGTA